MSSDTTWGVVATIKAPTTQILNFAAYHLDLGAHRVHIYLDEDDATARSALKRHPKCRVIHTDEGYWRRRRKHKGRPGGHQFRQTLNATHCYNRRPEVTWLLHADVDEFLLPSAPLTEQLDALPAETLSARVRPIEALAPDPSDPPPAGQIWCKGFARLQAKRREETNAIYPTYGDHLNGGFLSHVAGKVFVRTEETGISLRIHNAFRNKQIDADPPELATVRLVHLHAHSWEHWQNLYRYRLQHGSYRVGLKPAPMPDGAALNMHHLFSMLEAEGGETALRAFYDEVCTASPALRDRLARFGRLHAVTLDLDTKRARHFPNHA
ncbi:glycosyltransferase family 2 protein [Roseovarius aestuariivivens]|uniref:glycosyltransferase family 2 protein n=1 Tax=Roseovarius aestuariivivens TaxID=1888910 RepID=UPI001081C895|nr:glycosyltransferase family 2 protein [Roseovarius aestuariivivens]